MSDVRDIPSADALAAMSSRERGRHEARVRVAARRQGLEMVKRWMPESMRPRYVLVDPATRAQVSDVWVAVSAPGSGDLLLQMDIEGAEWPVLLNVSRATLRRFRIIVVELHDLTKVLDRDVLPVLRAMLHRLLDDFHVVHLHPNNSGGLIRLGAVAVPRTLEMTLLRRDRAPVAGYTEHFPHPLDCPNAEDIPDVELPFVWYAP